MNITYCRYADISAVNYVLIRLYLREIFRNYLVQEQFWKKKKKKK